jgi:hypothetical protein
MDEHLMATIPTPPSFAFQDSSLDNLTALAKCVTFLADCGTRPVFRLFRQTSTQAVSGAGLTVVTLAGVAYDDDGVSDGTGATIVTQGWYDFSACANFVSATGQQAYGVIQVTTGTHNINYTNGTVLTQALQGGQNPTLASSESDFSFGSLSSACLYPGDKVRLAVNTGGAGTIEYNSNNSYIQGRFPPTLSGMWIRTGT